MHLLNRDFTAVKVSSSSFDHNGLLAVIRPQLTLNPVHLMAKSHDQLVYSAKNGLLFDFGIVCAE